VLDHRGDAARSEFSTATSAITGSAEPAAAAGSKSTAATLAPRVASSRAVAS
jgi:hypothetical protein